jgi:hypothetical protein
MVKEAVCKTVTEKRWGFKSLPAHRAPLLPLRGAARRRSVSVSGSGFFPPPFGEISSGAAERGKLATEPKPPSLRGSLGAR